MANPWTSSSNRGKLNPSKAKGLVEGGSNGCSYYGNMKHTREMCFKLHGYPEWWTELKARKLREFASRIGRAAMVNAEPMTREPKLSLAPLMKSKELMTAPLDDQGNNYCYNSSALLISKEGNNNDWIVDSRATDHMTFCPYDFVKTT